MNFFGPWKVSSRVYFTTSLHFYPEDSSATNKIKAPSQGRFYSLTALVVSKSEGVLGTEPMDQDTVVKEV